MRGVTDLNALAHRVQDHVPEQPWGSYGHDPVPISIDFSNGQWGVKFVLGLNGSGTKRRWDYVSGPTLEEALLKARSRQMRDKRRMRDGKEDVAEPV